MPGRHLSVSQLRLLLGCARQWRLQYLEGLRPPPTVDLVVGVVWHAAIEHHLGGRVAGRPGDVEASRRVLAQAWAKEAARPRIDWRRETPESARRLTDRLFDAYVRDLAPLLTPVAVEQPFSVPIPGADGWTFDGRIDAVADDGWLIDQKTAGAPYTPEQVDADLQALAYLWAWRELRGAGAPGVAFHVAVKPAPRGEGAITTQEIVTRRTAAQLDWFAGLLREAVRQVEAEALPPDPGYRWCPRCPAVWAARCMPWRTSEASVQDDIRPGAGGAIAAGLPAAAGHLMAASTQEGANDDG
jgi:PD-(D/E)XK nuclease superfamily